MKKIFSFLAVSAMCAASQLAAADVITLAVVSDGTVETTLDTTSDDPIYEGTSAVLQRFTAGGLNYNIVSGADGYVGDVEGVVFSLGGTSPGLNVAVSDFDLSTGTLDPLGDGGPAGIEYFDFRTQTITSETVFFLFNNGTPTASVTLVDSAGTPISNSISITDLGGEETLNNFAYSRTNGGDLNDRDVAGNIFAVSEFTLNDGATIDDIAGFRGGGSTFDAQDAGIAVEGPAPPDTLIGDVNLDGIVNFLDISPFIARLSTGDFQAEADIDMNGLVNFLDISPFITLLSQQ